MKEQEEQEDRARELLEEFLTVVQNDYPKSSNVQLRYIIRGIDIDVSMSPLHGYTLGESRAKRWATPSER